MAIPIGSVPRRPSNVPKSAWGKMGSLEKYNLWKGLLAYDSRTKGTKPSGLTLEDIKKSLYRDSRPKPSVTRDFKEEERKKSRHTKSRKKKREDAIRKGEWIYPISSHPSIVSGRGTFELSDGGTYVGQIQKGVFHGIGTRIWKDGSRYDGRWKDGVRHGQGRMTHSNGSEYHGRWENDTKTGRGTVFNKNGSMYVGDWRDDLVEVPYTKLSESEKSLKAYNLYKKYQGDRLQAPSGTYAKIGKQMGVSRKKAIELVHRHRYLLQREETPKKKRKKPSRSIDKLDLPDRVTLALRKHQIHNLRTLTRFTATDLRSFPQIGQKAVTQIKKSLKKFGLELSSAQYYEGRGSQSLRFRNIGG